MITICYRKTMNGAKRTVPDTEISLRRASRRDAVVSLAQSWNLAQEARKRQERARKLEAKKAGTTLTDIEREQALSRRRDVEAVKERTRAFVHNPDDSKRTVRWLIKSVALENGVLPEAILSKSHIAFHVAVRHQAMVRAYLAHPNMSLSWLSKPFNCDHSTFLNALQKSGQWQRREVT